MTLNDILNKVAILGVCFLVGCSSVPEKPRTIVMSASYADKVPVPKVAPTDIKAVEWMLLDRTTMLAYLDANPGEFVVYALTEDGTSIMMGNIQELRRYIQSQQEVINYLLSVMNAGKEDVKK